MESARHIDWGFVTGFSLIGCMILIHFVLCLRKKVFHARGSYVFQEATPKSFWVLIFMEATLLLIVFGGVGLYLCEGGPSTDGSAATPVPEIIPISTPVIPPEPSQDRS